MNPFKFSSIWTFIPISYLFLFLPQLAIGVFYLGGSAAYELLKIIYVGLLAYFIGYKAIKYFFSKRSHVNYRLPTLSKEGVLFFTIGIFTAYFLVLLYAILTSEKVPLWEALSGATSLEIAESREMLFRSRVGGEKILIYLYSILTSVFIPYFLMLIFLNRNKLAWPLYIAFYLSLLIPMEKVLFVKAFLPFFLIAANGYLSRRALYIAPIVAAVFLLSMNYLARGSDVGASQGTLTTSIDRLPPNQLDSCTNIIQNGRCLTLEEHVEKYYPLRGTTAVGYLINRALWIPYVTAYDWVQYFEQELDGVHTKGLTSALISKLLEKEKIPMEQYVFDYQFGLGPTQTAGANANFMVDGYINFGMIGVILLSGLVGFFIAIIENLKNPAACACVYLFLFQLLGGGFLGTFLGGGFALFLLLVYFFRPSYLTVNSPSFQK
jgi:hypothetical protein